MRSVGEKSNLVPIEKFSHRLGHGYSTDFSDATSKNRRDKRIPRTCDTASGSPSTCLYRTSPILPAALPLSWQHGLIAILVRNAALGVDVFFVLSGFVLYLPYRAGSRQFLSRADVKTFYKHRANRLLPLYFIVVLIGLIFHTQNPIGSLKWYAEGIGLVTGLFDLVVPMDLCRPRISFWWSVGSGNLVQRAIPFFRYWDQFASVFGRFSLRLFSSVLHSTSAAS